MATNPNYHSYLLRFWRDSADQPWRASLQRTENGERLAFAEIETLFTFLLHCLEGKDEKEVTPTLTQVVQQASEV